MKKIVILILTLGLIVTTGCEKSDNSSNVMEQGANSSNFQKDKANSDTENTDKENIDITFFFKDSGSECNYSGKFLFDEPVEKDVNLHINKVAYAKDVVLYELKLDSIDGVPEERLNLGCFYVKKDKIFRIEPTEENLNKLKSNEQMPNDSVIVCQYKEMKDTLGNNERGWHHYLKVDGDKREYHSYNNSVETGYYESFIWEKNKGLINYRSGYGAERDSIDIQLINDTSSAEKSDVSI